MVDSPTVAIIGSGIAGSAAAWRLATVPSTQPVRTTHLITLPVGENPRVRRRCATGEPPDHG